MRFRAAPLALVVSCCLALCASCSRSQDEKSPAEPTAPAPEAPPAAEAPPAPEPTPAAEAPVFDFDDDAVDRPPAGFTAALTGGGGAIDWRVQQRDDAPSGSNVVAQLSADETNARYPHLVLDDVVAKDVDVSVSFRTISGKVDASGGLMFRYRDADNFYVVRANALEDNVVAYKTENGKRRSIGVKGDRDAYGVDAKVPHRQWTRLRVVARDRLFEVYLDERKLFEVDDDAFADAGRVGLWTKADAVTEFDDLRVQTLD